MNANEYKQSDFMTLQLMEIESFRKLLSQQSDESITIQEAFILWISGGYADEFKSEYPFIRNEVEPAIA